MELNKYQEQAMKTCMSTSNNFSYMMLNLVGEVGEFASKVAKAIRKDMVYVGHQIGKPDSSLIYINVDKESDTYFNALDEELKKELGDILWQVSGIASVMGWSLEDIAQQNLDKLASRQQRGKIDGEGDNR